MVAKMDLSKAYDNVFWIYLTTLLIHIGFSLDVENWIMACVSSVFFVILMNGVASPFFISNQGFRQGFPLFPYLFLLVA